MTRGYLNNISMDLKDIQKQLDKVVHEQNNGPLPQFEGYSPLDMYKIFHFTFGA